MSQWSHANFLNQWCWQDLCCFPATDFRNAKFSGGWYFSTMTVSLFSCSYFCSCCFSGGEYEVVFEKKSVNFLLLIFVIDTLRLFFLISLFSILTRLYGNTFTSYFIDSHKANIEKNWWKEVEFTSLYDLKSWFFQ